MSQTMSPLDSLRLPLRGSQLIEASAGTGKTYTIAMLYVRLVLGHGAMLQDATGNNRTLTPPDILVVTFTEAATQELRDRIRARLAQAAQFFRQPEQDVQGAQDEQDALQQLRAEYPPAHWPACARKLELAAEWMDEAAISTIHGWCKRMLREHAFASRSQFEQQLETDQSELLAEVVRDYWRKFFYPLNEAASQAIRTYWCDPVQLGAAVKPLLAHVAQLQQSTADDPAQIIASHLAAKQQQLEALKQPWLQWVEELRQFYADSKVQGLFHATKLNQKNFSNWLDKLSAWASDAQSETLDLKTGWTRLTPAGMAEAWKAPPAPAHPAFAAIVELQPALAALPDSRTPLLLHATRWIDQQFEQARRQRAQIGFDDLLHGLAQALQDAQGAHLAELIRQQFPVALIDEFQDTDPVQYRIFEHIYAPTENRQDCALILIGDPKQAIYAFRGADIHTYLQARRAMAGRIHTLNKNFRSTAAMVDAVNHCFNLAEQQTAGAGAFLFRQHASSAEHACAEQENPVPFLPVEAAGREDTFCVEGQAQAALQLVLAAAEAGESQSKESYLQRLSAICATQIVSWLNQAQHGEAGFASVASVTSAAKPHADGQAQQALKALQPGDIAVLVNNRNEAASIRSALAQRGVRSVYLSDRDNVYATPQAVEVYRWLAACAQPDQAKLLRAALATATLGLTLAELDALNHDEAAWEERVMQFKGYRELWQRSGVLPMLRRLLLDFQCGERLLSASLTAAAADEYSANQSGERRMTDILHLAEILQQASTQLEGEHALLRFLAEQMSAAGDADGSGQEGKRLRLESDAELVQVITIHKSKGLEYPVVCLPFICATRALKETDVPLKWHDADGELQIALQADAQIVQQAEQERLAEDLRKLYVALTRARYLTWLGLAPIKNNAASAIGYLLGMNGVEDADAFQQAVCAAATGAAASSVQTLTVSVSHANSCLAPQPTASPPLLPLPGKARRLSRAVREHWWIGSYSSLRISSQMLSAGASLAAVDDTAQMANLQETLHEQAASPAPALGSSRRLLPADSVHAFPKGAVAGTFLHDVLEWLANSADGFASATQHAERLREHLQSVCQARGWDHWVESLQGWLQQLVSRDLPLAGETIQLQQLHKSSLRAEMEFWLPAQQVDLQRLDALVCQHTLAGRPRPALSEPHLNGMLKGFMDLVFEHQGRYYVADYKSNWLGDGDVDSDYSTERMDEAIRTHRYDLQYVIYLFALHRLLRSRLPDYDYERHVGGALYLFLRGIEAATAGVHFERPPASLMAALDALFAGDAHEHAHECDSAAGGAS